MAWTFYALAVLIVFVEFTWAESQSPWLYRVFGHSWLGAVARHLTGLVIYVPALCFLFGVAGLVTSLYIIVGTGVVGLLGWGLDWFRLFHTARTRAEMEGVIPSEGAPREKTPDGEPEHAADSAQSVRRAFAVAHRSPGPYLPSAAVSVLGTLAVAFVVWRSLHLAPTATSHEVWHWVRSGLESMAPGKALISAQVLLAYALAYLMVVDPATYLIRGLLGSLRLTPEEDLETPGVSAAGKGGAPFGGRRGCFRIPFPFGGRETAASSEEGQAVEATVFRPMTPPSPELYNAGRVIGDLERIIMLTLVVAGQYGAVGLVVAAKSIARSEVISQGQAEYYLIGTLASILLSVAVGVLLLSVTS